MNSLTWYQIISQTKLFSSGDKLFSRKRNISKTILKADLKRSATHFPSRWYENNELQARIQLNLPAYSVGKYLVGKYLIRSY